MRTTVVNVKYEPCDVYIGRSWGRFSASKWGNPYRIGLDGTREEVIKLYAGWLVSKLKGDPTLLEELRGMYGKRLGCWCAPLPCHGDYLASLINVLGSGPPDVVQI